MDIYNNPEPFQKKCLNHSLVPSCVNVAEDCHKKPRKTLKITFTFSEQIFPTNKSLADIFKNKRTRIYTLMRTRIYTLMRTNIQHTYEYVGKL